MADVSDSPRATLVRNREHVQREYGTEKWPAVERLIEQRSAGEPPGGASLARVHRRVARDYAYLDRPMAEIEVWLGGRRQRLASSLAWGSQARLISDAIVDACTASTDLVVELGSGWGWHVLGAWLAGGPRDALYVGAEYTEAGRRATQSLADLDADLRLRTHAFDYNDPSSLRSLGTFRDAVVFSVHSIEQIPRLSPEVPRAIAGLAETVRCLHFEPVGWQVSRDGGGSSSAYAERHDYNRDLLDVLRAEEASGGLSIDAIELDLVGLNPANTTSLVRWSSRA
jgi:hypothetical protein